MRSLIFGLQDIWISFLIVCAWTCAAIAFHLKAIPVDVLGSAHADLVRAFGYNFVGGYAGALIAGLGLVTCCFIAIVVGGRQSSDKA